MKSTKMLAMLVLVLCLIFSAAGVKAQVPLGTAFTYQSYLMDKKNPANDIYDFEFSLYDDPNVGIQVGSTLLVDDVNVVDGHFQVELDFGGGIFTGDARWLETEVRQGASTDPCDFVTLSPRQELTPTPYSIYAETAGAVPGGITGSGITNNIPIFIDPNTLANSVIYESAGNVGIGLMNPSQRLDVAGVIKVVADNPTFLFHDVNALSIDDRYFMMKGSNQDLNFISLLGNMEYEQQIMVIKSTGNVGIGTTSPDEKLHVAGSIKIVDGSQGDGKVLTSNAGGVASWQDVPGSAIPSGVIVMWSGAIANIPAGWALCDGTNGTPDLRDRFIVGAKQDDGGVAKTNVKGSLMKVGGEHEHTLTTVEMPAHTHTESGHGSYGSQARDDPIGCQQTTQTGSTGGDQPHENCPPFYALAYIMKL